MVTRKFSKVLGTLFGLPARLSTLMISCLILGSGFILGCSGGTGSVSSSGSSASTSVSITLTGINGSSASSTGSTTVVVSSNSLTGTCTRGVSKINVSIDGSTQTDGPTCTGLGAFTYTKTYTDGTHTIVFTPADKNGTAITGASGFSKTLIVDTVAPAKPVISSSVYLSPMASVSGGSSASVTALGTSISVSGTCDTDVDRIKVYLGGVYTTSISQNSSGSGTWTYTYTIPQNGSYSFGFRAYDAAGNTASGAATTLAINYNSVLILGQSFQPFKAGTDATILYQAAVDNGTQINSATTPATGANIWFQYGLIGVAE